MKYDVFVSYRRNSFESANLISEKLRSMGYNVFFDVETLRSGKFNEQLFEVIDNCNDFVLVLPPNALDRCADEDDWVRKEVTRAMSGNKNIIPVLLANFEWPNPMPIGMEELSNYQSIVAGEKEFFDMSMQRLAGYLKSKKHKDMRKFYKKFAIVVTSVMLLCCISGAVVVQMAKALCYDIAVSLTLEMDTLNALRQKQTNFNNFWTQYVKDMRNPNISPEDAAINTEFLNKQIQNLEHEVIFLQNINIEKYYDFTHFQGFLLNVYDIVPQNIAAFSSFYDVLFKMALDNIQYLKSVANAPLNPLTEFMVAKHFEGWGYPLKSLYYNYMAEISSMPKNAKEYYYENADFTFITDPTTLNKDQSEYEKLAAIEMEKYQNIANEIKLFMVGLGVDGE